MFLPASSSSRLGRGGVIVEYSLGSQHFRAAFGGKCARNQTVDMKWIKIALEYCDLALISSLEQKTSNIQCKI